MRLSHFSDPRTPALQLRIEPRVQLVNTGHKGIDNSSEVVGGRTRRHTVKMTAGGHNDSPAMSSAMRRTSSMVLLALKSWFAWNSVRPRALRATTGISDVLAAAP